MYGVSELRLGHLRLSQKIVVALCMLILGGCDQLSEPTPYAQIQGSTMGTYYTVQHDHCDVVRNDIERRLDSLNTALSTYQPDSEISVFNQARQGKIFHPSAALLKTLEGAKHIYQTSGGAFDPTVGPLVDLWGFGPDDATNEQPSQEALDELRSLIGFEKVLVRDDTIAKVIDGVALDLSAIAKGYAVDVLASLLKDRGCTNFMVDIGGELVLAGLNASAQAWRVGVEKPDTSNLGSIQLVLSLSGAAVATSGDYRNFRLIAGKRVDHVMDPRRLAPADNEVVAVTVVHANAMFADGFATAAMVLGVDDALKLAQEEGFAVLLMTKSGPDDPIEIHYNAAMAVLSDGLKLDKISTK